jgi:hypothetical protein
VIRGGLGTGIVQALRALHFPFFTTKQPIIATPWSFRSDLVSSSSTYNSKQQFATKRHEKSQRKAVRFLCLFVAIPRAHTVEETILKHFSAQRRQGAKIAKEGKNQWFSWRSWPLCVLAR